MNVFIAVRLTKNILNVFQYQKCIDERKKDKDYKIDPKFDEILRL